MSRPLAVTITATLLALATLLPPLVNEARAQPVDLELSLLLDSSISVTDAQFALEMNAVADLVGDAAVIPQDGSVALDVVLYATRATEAVPFTHVRNAADAAALAAAIRAVPRVCCRTGIADGLRVAVAAMSGNTFEGRRKVIDVAGNGVENAGSRLDIVRADALLVVDAINGLPITEGEPDLLRYYQDEVIGGGSAFAYEARTWNDFGAALRAKLLRELGRCAPPPSGLVAWWAFDREHVDVECDLAGVHGGQRLGCPAHEPGRFGDALTLDGVDDALIVLPAADLAGSTGLTVAASLRTLAGSGDVAVLDRRDASGQGWRLSIANGAPRVLIASATGGIDLQATTNVADGAWHHVACTVSPDLAGWRVDVAVDGLIVSTGMLGDAPPLVDAALIVGADALDAASARFAGALDDVQVFDRALSAAELVAVANLPSGGQCGWSSGCEAVTFEGERCLWPPSHGLTCFADAGVLFPDVPAAHGLPIHVIDCRSNQPDNAGGSNHPWYWRGYQGDGNTVDDCVIAADQASFCVRSERSGGQRQGREYLVTLTLDCGGMTYSTIRLLVPHDMREQPDCTTTGRSATRIHPRSSR